MEVVPQLEIQVTNGLTAQRKVFGEPTVNRPVQNRRPLVKSGTAGVLIITTWFFLGLYDTGLATVIPSKNAVRFVLIALVGLVAGLSVGVNPGIRWNRMFFSASLLAVAVAIVSSLQCEAPELGLIKLVLYSCVFIPLVGGKAASQILCGQRRGRGLMLFAACALIGLGLYRGVRPLQEEIGNTNFLSSLSLCAMPIVMLEHAALKPIVSRKVLMAFLGLAFLACVLNHSRGAVVGAIVLLGTWAIFRKRPSLQSLIILGFFASSTMVAWYVVDESVSAFAFKGRDRLFDQNRTNEFDLAIETTAQSPLLGYGFGLSWRVKRSHVDQVLKHGRMSWYIGEFGNSTVAILSGGGVLLLIVVAMLLGSALQRAFVTMKVEHKLRGATVEYKTLTALFCGSLGLLTHSQAEGWIMSPATMATFSFWMYIGGMLFMTATIAKSHSVPPGRVGRPTL